MSEKTTNLQLPYILAAQAQKHVTHNEAIRALDTLIQISAEDKDLNTPPISPSEGNCYLVASPATGEWSGKENNIAAFQDGAWMFYEPFEGWVSWLRDEDIQVVYDGTSWLTLSGGGAGVSSLNPATGNLLGVNATADTTNRLAVSSPASLFDHEGNDHQLKINKQNNTDTASVLFQTGYSGRAEFGLTGDDDFHMKVSPDGTTFFDGIVIDKDTGAVTFPNTVFAGGGGSGDIIGPSGATNEAVALFDSTTGKILKNSVVTIDASGNIVTAGTVDGRDISADGAKLDNIETAATSDQTGSEIKALYEAEADTNAYDDAAVTKLASIEAGADVTDLTNVTAALNGATLSAVTVATNDKLIIQDTSDSDNVKTITAQSIADLATTIATDISVGSDVQGDILYHDGTKYTRLPAGTSGKFLKTQGPASNPVWETIAGGGDMLSANNLSDVANPAIARENLGIGASTDLFALALRIADLEGDALGLLDGIADAFDDETDVDVAFSSGVAYDAINELYSPYLAMGGNDSNTFLMFHCEGYDTSTTFTDSSSGGAGSPHTLTARGNAQIDTAKSKFGSASILFDGTGDDFDIPDSADWDLGSGDFTFDFWVWHAVSGNEEWYMSQGATAGSTWSFGCYKTSGNKLNFNLSSNGTRGSLFDQTSTESIPTGQWVHIAVARDSGNIRGFIDGVEVTWTTTVSGTVFSSGQPFYFGDEANRGMNQFNGWLDELRYSNGIARWTAAFTPPTAPYGAGAAGFSPINLQSNSFTADSPPSTGRLCVLAKPNEAFSINTDLIGSISRDGGTTFTAATLVAQITYSDGTVLYEDSSIDISGQPSGTSMKWKVETANNKDIDVSGIVLQWS